MPSIKNRIEKKIQAPHIIHGLNRKLSLAESANNNMLSVIELAQLLKGALDEKFNVSSKLYDTEKKWKLPQVGENVTEKINGMK